MKPTLLVFSVLMALSAPAQQLFIASVPQKATAPIAPLRNPDRGLHLESIYQATDVAGYIPNPYGRGAGQGQTGAEVYPEGFMDTRNKDFHSAGDSITLTQLYIYLTSFWDTDVISPEGLNNIQTLLNGLREKRVKAILRFAYSRDNGYIGNGHSGSNPGAARTLEHLKQIKPLLVQNRDVISLVEAGFIGTWGEWTPRYSAAENAAIAASLMEAIPQGYGMVVRYLSIRNELAATFSADQMARIGFANDYFTTGLKNCGSSDWCTGSADYNRVADISFDVYMRGEIPYNEGPPWGFDILMPPADVLSVLKAHHYSAMDITQNFADNVSYWKTVAVSPAMLRNLHIFFDEAYFTQPDGEIVPRTLYDFIRDHLGYRLNVLPKPALTVEGSRLRYEINLTNTGFATVLNPRPVYLVLIDDNGRLSATRLSDVNPRSWQPWAKGAPDALLGHTLSGAIDLPQAKGRYRVGLWLPDANEEATLVPDYCIKLATDNGAVSHWRDAGHVVNVIGEIDN